MSKIDIKRFLSDTNTWKVILQQNYDNEVKPNPEKTTMITYLDVAEDWSLWVKYMPESDWCSWWFEHSTIEERIAKQVEEWGPE